MTEKELEMAKYIKDNILPRVQEMQRDTFFDKHIIIHVDGQMLHGGLSATVFVSEDNFSAFSEYLNCTIFSFHTIGQTKKSIDKLMRGMCYFVKNWQERLG